MASVDTFIFVSGVLLLLGIASSKAAARVGMPVLVLFLGVGMLAGSEGLGGIAFADYGLANGIGTLALAVILFDGGLRTQMASVRRAWKPALALSTLGVLITSGLTGLAAAWLLGLPLLNGLLLGAIVGSTDAAAVFSVLRAGGLTLPDRLAATLEIESGSNDPMAIFLTLGLIQVVAGTAGSAVGLLGLLVLQFGVGGAAGAAVGWVAGRVVNRIQLDAAGLYPVLAVAFGLLAFGLAAVLGGSGFLAVYIAGIVLGNHDIVFKRGILNVHDAAAWLGQIVLFVMLGLLSFPSRLPAAVVPGLLVAFVLIVVARPLAVVLCALPFRFPARERAFLSWGGLKGAVPITLATFPLTAGLPGAEVLFDVTFFVVLVSAIVQGASLPTAARWLRLSLPSPPPAPVTVEIHALRHVDGEIVEYTVAASARVAGQALRDLPMPDGVLVTLVVRGGDVVLPRGATRLQPGDHVFVTMRRSLDKLIDRLFDPFAETPPLEPGLVLSFPATATLGQLHRFFGIPAPTWSEETLGERLGAAEQTRLGPFVISDAGDADYLRILVDPLPGAAEEPPVGLARAGAPA